MKIAIIGATGTIGSAVADRLAASHELVRVGHSSGDHQVDLADRGSIERLFAALGQLDAVVCCAGQARFGPLDELGDDDFMLGLRNKVMGQANLVRAGRAHVRDGGSFTLTSGLLAREPAPGTAAIAMCNAAVEGFARAAALELERGQRINVVAPPWVRETLVAMGREGGMPVADVARAYQDSVEGTRSGHVIDARDAG